jgi:hypothetical protein
MITDLEQQLLELQVQEPPEPVDHQAGLTNSVHFAKIRQNLADSGRPEFKMCRILFINSKKIKVNK